MSDHSIMAAGGALEPEGVAHLIERAAIRYGEAPALVCGGRTVSFRALESRARRVAAALRHSGCSVASRVAFCAPSSETYFEVLYGSAMIRAVFVPLNGRLIEGEITEILADSDAEILFLSQSASHWVAALRQRCQRLRQVVLIADEECGMTDYSRWVGACATADERRVGVADDVVVQLYTSGTTGKPKGVELTNANYAAVIRQCRTAGWVDWRSSDRALVCMPLFHVGGVNVSLIAATCGACAIVTSRADTATILDGIQRYGITIAFMAPVMLADLVRTAQENRADISSVRLIYYGASAITETALAKVRSALDAGFVQLYGLTETAGSITYLSPEAHRSGGAKLRSCGRPNVGTEIRIVDTGGATLPSGSKGEIVMRGPTLMRGYWKQPNATSAAMKDGWFHTGDVGYFDDEGYLYICDRLKDIIVSGGENIFPAEIENAIAKHPSIAEVAVVGVPDAKWGEAVKAVVVLRAGFDVDERALLEHLRRELAGFKLPKSIEFRGALPKSAAGKILRRAVREPYWAGRARLIN